MDEVLFKRMQQIAREKTFSALMGGSDTSPQDQGDDPLTFAMLEEAWQKLEEIARQPRPIAIWCVDRREWIEQIKLLLGMGYRSDYTPVPFDGYPLREYYTIFHDPEREVIATPQDDLGLLRIANPGKVVFPWWCRYPGVWIEMSNGEIWSIFDGSILPPI